MAKLTSLLAYYYESMRQELQALEEKRLQVIKRLQTIGFFVAGAALIAFVFLHRYAQYQPLHAALLSAMGGFLIFMFFYRHEKAGFDTLFKDHVIEKLIHLIDPSLRYEKSRSILEEEYRRSELFLESVDRFEGSDLVSGQADEVNLRFSFLHVEKKERDKNNKEQWHDIFKGLFFIADFNKTFHSKTVVLPDFAEKTLGVLGSWMQSLNVARGQLMKLDHVEFEKAFVVYGEDPIESRYILSHALMEKIVQLHQKIRKPLYLSFVDSQIFIAIPYTKSLFEPILTQSLLEFASIRGYFELLNTMIGIVEELKLNEKLWSRR
jgi:hypothetical protein